MKFCGGDGQLNNLTSEPFHGSWLISLEKSVHLRAFLALIINFPNLVMLSYSSFNSFTLVGIRRIFTSASLLNHPHIQLPNGNVRPV